MDNQKVYLGDSVYAAFDGYHVWLTTENGSGPSNKIALEPKVVNALFSYLSKLYDEAEETEGAA